MSNLYIATKEQPKILTGGFSGDILMHLPPSVLRLYKGGQNIRNIALLKILGTIGVSPQIYHDFGTGHIEEYIDGVPLSVVDTEEMFFLVARVLAQLHAIPLTLVPIANVWDPWTEVAECIDDFRNVTASKKDNKDIFTDKGFSLDEVSVEIEGLHNLLRPFLEADSAQWCLSHNDLFRGNIMRCRDGVRLIDWEMTALFHPLYDVANFFCECCMDMSLNYDANRFPSSDRQVDFIRICLGRDPNERDMYILRLFILLSHLYWAASGTDGVPEYALMRFTQYRKSKANLVRFI